MSSELLKQAIADAKAVRATALANAKAALEEAFAPKLQSMLATKLQQEVEGEDEDVTDEVPVADAAPVADEAPIETPAPEGEQAPEADLPIDGIGGETDTEAGFTPEAEPTETPADGDNEDEIEELSLGAGHPDPVDQTDELTEADDSNYKKTTTGVKTDDPQGASKELSSGPGKADKNVTAGDPKEKTSGKKTVKRDVASISDDPQGASKELSAGPGKADKDQTGKVLEENDDEISEQSLDEILKELESEVSSVAGESTDDATNEVPTDPATTQGYDDPQAGSITKEAADETEIDLDELLSEDDSECEDDEAEETEEDKDDKKPDFLKENKNLKAELSEYRKAVEFLRSRINEVNLLNAKLLYTNRLFKASNLTKEQKIKVIESFDLTKSVREAKIVYTTLAESLNFGARKATSTVVKPAAKTTLRTITEGLASKVVASTKPSKTPEVLTEGAEMASRFQKLAGIKK
jgi:hypothetical protein